MARKITRASNDFTKIFESLILPTVELRLCTDHALVEERDKAQQELDAAQAEADVTARARRDAGDASLADEFDNEESRATARAEAARAALDDIDARIDASDATLVLEAATPSEEDMAKIQHLNDDGKRDDWNVRLVGLALGQTPEKVRAMREHIHRATWQDLLMGVYRIVGEGSVSVPTRRPGSESSPASLPSSAQPAPGE